MDDDGDIAPGGVETGEDRGLAVWGFVKTSATAIFGSSNFISKSAARALHRLVGPIATVANAHADAYAGDVRAEAENRRTISKAVAKEVAKAAASDPDVVSRGVRKWEAEVGRKQRNVEAVAGYTMTELKLAHDRAPDAPLSESEGPSDDFMNLFAECAERASSENLQTLLGRILAGEIRKPGAFSLRTLMLMSVMDRKVADTIQTGKRWVQDGDMLVTEAIHNDPAIALLVELGIVLPNVIFKQSQMPPGLSHYIMPFKKKGLVFFFTDPAHPRIDFNYLKVTSLGKEVFSILPDDEDNDYIKQVGMTYATQLPDHPIKRVDFGDIVELPNGQIGVSTTETIYQK